MSITLHPATAQDQDSQFVRCTLVLAVSPQVGSCPRWALWPLSLLSSVRFGFCWFVLFSSIPMRLQTSPSATRGDCQMSKSKSECR